MCIHTVFTGLVQSPLQLSTGEKVQLPSLKNPKMVKKKMKPPTVQLQSELTMGNPGDYQNQHLSNQRKKQYFQQFSIQKYFF